MNTLLVTTVKNQLCCDDIDITLNDIASYGASGGFGGFIYYNETSEFFDENKALIIELVEDSAGDMGMGALEMIAGFNCLNSEYSIDEVGAVLFGEADNQYIKNSLVWFALESVAYHESN